ncbi:hypothetical protein TWF694_009157 [Orbilia ellipsospora]|uniref:Peptidase metallopeptidase domain-containing protein n=1 Tax=Orbilia ellipsospora TaxID=2528407 RepID=A0AAV9XFA2_9PEZI
MCQLLEKSEDNVKGCGSTICKRQASSDANQKWPDGTVFQYRLVGVLPGSDTATMESAFALAWEKWAQMCPTYKFQKATGNNANITISVVSSNDKDFAGGQAAGFAQKGPDAYLKGYVKFRNSALPSWSKASIHTLFLHEFGHVLGLGHSANKAAIMAPIIDKMTTIRPLTSEDQSRIKNFIASKTAAKNFYSNSNRPQTPQTPQRNSQRKPYNDNQGQNTPRDLNPIRQDESQIRHWRRV